jgi:hypothetical protein
VKRTRDIVILGLVAVTAISTGACGGDDDDDPTASDSGVEAVAPPPASAFDGLSAALEAEGLVVAPLPKGSLQGAEVGVGITGDKSGSARSFPTETKAREYAAEVAKSGDKTTIVGTVVLQAATQEDADFFADAYKG